MTTVRVYQWVQVLVPVRMVIRHIMMESLHSCPVDPFGLAVRLRNVGGAEIVIGDQVFT